MFGILLMVVLENITHHFMAKMGGGRGRLHQHVHASGADLSVAATAASAPADDVEDGGKLYHSGKAEGCPADSSFVQHQDAIDAGHSHSCIAANTAANSVRISQHPSHQSSKDLITAYMFELGCVVHSFLIGESWA